MTVHIIISTLRVANFISWKACTSSLAFTVLYIHIYICNIGHVEENIGPNEEKEKMIAYCDFEDDDDGHDGPDDMGAE